MAEKHWSSKSAKFRKILFRLPETSSHKPVSVALNRATEIGETGIASAVKGLISMPQSTMVFANPILHNTKVDCNGADITLKIRSFAIRGIISEGEIVAGKLTPAEIIFTGLFGRRPQKSDEINESQILQILIDRKFYRAINFLVKDTDGKEKPIVQHVAEFVKVFPETGPELLIQKLASLRKAGRLNSRRIKGISDQRHNGVLLCKMIKNHMENVAIGSMSAYMRRLLNKLPNLSAQNLAEMTGDFIEKHKAENKTAFQSCYSLLLGRKANDAENKMLERMGTIQIHHGSAASNVVARYMATLHVMDVLDLFSASQLILDGKRHFGAIHNMTKFINELEPLSDSEREAQIRAKVLTGGLPTFGHPEISAAGRGSEIQQDPRAAIYLTPLFEAIDRGELEFSEEQLKRLAIVQRIYQIVFAEGVLKPGRENEAPLRLTPNTDFGAWSVQEGLGIDEHDRTMLTYIFRGFGWMMDSREQLQQKIMRPVIAPDPSVIPVEGDDLTVPDSVVKVHDRLVATDAFRSK